MTLSEKLQWTTPAGLSVSLPVEKRREDRFFERQAGVPERPEARIGRLDALFRTAKPLPAMEQFYAPRFDRGFDSSPLRLGGIPYRKGLALRSRTEIVYRLPAAYKRFQAIVGIDDAVRPGGKVRLVVRGDDKCCWRVVVAGSDAPRPLDLDVTGVRRLTILADFADGLTAGDHLLLCHARLSK